MRLTDVRCNSLKNPIGIDDIRPVFSWKIDAGQNDVYQLSYRIQVRDEENNLVWDSREMHSDQSVNVVYEGNRLRGKTAYIYDVTVKTNVGSVLYSKGNTFEMGILNESEWVAKWIGRQSECVSGKTDKQDLGKILIDMMEGKDVDFTPDRKLEACNTYVKSFAVSETKLLKKARAYVSALGVYELKINGEIPCDVRFAPEFTDYDAYVEYQTYDIIPFLNGGLNTIEITLADGWYKGKFGMLGFGENYGSELAALIQIEMLYEDGSRDIIASDESFRYYTSPYVYSDIMIGERYDARLENAEKTYYPCKELGIGYEKLHGICAEPVIVTQRLAPKAILTSPAGDTILDFGQNIVGVVEMRVSGKAGTEVKLEHSEELELSENFANFIDGFNRDQTDYYVLKGVFEEVYQPKFTFHGFRYVRVSNYPGEVKAENFTACVLGTACAVSGSFTTSNSKLNQLQSNIQWSQRGNLLSIPTDCPQRERAGWTGDAWVYGETCCFNQDCQNFFKRWLRNMREEQFEDGLIPIIVPYSAGYKDIQLQSFGTHTSAGWGDIIVALPWYLYQIYGDKTVLEENYEAMLKWMGYVEREASSGVNLKEGEEDDPDALERQKYLWNTNFHFGDWLYPSCSRDNGESDMLGSATTTKEHVSTAIYANSTEIVSKVAELLGDTERQQYYSKLNENIRHAFAVEYVDDQGLIDNDLQGLYVMALAMNMVEDEKRPLLANRLTELIAENDGCLDTGFMSIKFLMDVLTENGKKETAKEILYQEKFPSWLYEVNHNATTIWERWNAILPDGTRTVTSYNHYAFGCIGDWMYRNLLGIRRLKPGYKKILIKPDFDFGLESVSGSYESVYGTIAVKWRLENGCKKVYIRIPANTVACLEYPDGTCETLGNGEFERTFS